MEEVWRKEDDQEGVEAEGAEYAKRESETAEQEMEEALD